MFFKLCNKNKLTPRSKSAYFELFGFSSPLSTPDVIEEALDTEEDAEDRLEEIGSVVT